MAQLRVREFEANGVAIDYLDQLSIPRDVLFDAIVKLSPAGAEPSAGNFRGTVGGIPRGPDATPAFAQMHYARQSAADIGRLLDGGLIPPPSTGTGDPSTGQARASE